MDAVIVVMFLETVWHDIDIRAKLTISSVCKYVYDNSGYLFKRQLNGGGGDGGSASLWSNKYIARFPRLVACYEHHKYKVTTESADSTFYTYLLRAQRYLLQSKMSGKALTTNIRNCVYLYYFKKYAQALFDIKIVKYDTWITWRKLDISYVCDYLIDESGCGIFKLIISDRRYLHRYHSDIVIKTDNTFTDNLKNAIGHTGLYQMYIEIINESTKITIGD
ncbi:hypothetical protein F-S17_0233 [Faustovirus]|nr:hypothetical protein F-S17_0233 [Faustovirus]